MPEQRAFHLPRQRQSLVIYGYPRGHAHVRAAAGGGERGRNRQPPPLNPMANDDNLTAPRRPAAIQTPMTTP